MTTPDRAPTELGELKKLLAEFVERFTYIENEMAGLREDQKVLIEDYEDRLDIKTLKQAIRIVKAKNKVKNLDTFETYEEILKDFTEL